VSATTGQVSGAALLPPGLIVEAGAAAIADAFAALCPLQPVRMEPGGLICAPRSAPELAGPALARCPLPVRALGTVPGWPDPPAAMVAGWYRRSPAHAPAPAGVRELIQATGEGFGPGDHATTQMCLELLEGLSGGPAVDVGCGSGLLAQAWVALGRGAVLACDLDPRALEQAGRSLRAAGRAGHVTLRRGPISALADDELADRVLLANIPLAAHRSLLSRICAPPRAVVLSGLRPPDAPAIAAAYRRLGLRILRRHERAGFVGLCMARGPGATTGGG
jgi:SAM-dependent methyltransferase